MGVLMNLNHLTNLLVRVKELENIHATVRGASRLVLSDGSHYNLRPRIIPTEGSGELIRRSLLTGVEIEIDRLRSEIKKELEKHNG
jgi:hypothetical protein